MVMGEAGDLRQMADAENLARLAQLTQVSADGFRGGSADAGVNFVEDEGVIAAAAAAGVGGGLERQHDAGDLAARGNAVERPQGLSGVRGDEELNSIVAGAG